MAPKFPDWRLEIVGEGPLREDLEKQIRKFDLQEVVFLPGFTEFVGQAYDTAEIFVISSSYEAFGLVTVEAMLHGLPVVGFADCPGTNELITDGVTGLLVEPQNDRVKALALALIELISNPPLRKSFGKAGREKMKDRFSIREIGNAWEELLEQSVSR